MEKNVKLMEKPCGRSNKCVLNLTELKEKKKKKKRALV